MFNIKPGTVLRRGLMALLAAGSAFAVSAQDFPRKPITIIFSVAAGGPADHLLRPILAKAQDTLGQQILIDPRPGASGAISVLALKRSAPDGYTLLLTHTAIQAINQYLIKDLPYDPIKDFKPITPYAMFRQVLVVPAKSPYKTVADLVAAAKATKGGLTYDSVGVGTASHLNAAMLGIMAGVPLTHSIYKGTAQIYFDLSEGRGDIYFTQYPQAAPWIKDGKLRAIATASPRRLAYLPDLPTMAESGYAIDDVAYWYGLAAPAGTPDAIIGTLYNAFAKAIRDPEISKRLEAEDSGGGGITPAEFQTLIANDAAKYGKLVKSAGIQPQ